MTIYSVEHKYLRASGDLGFNQKYYKQRSLSTLSTQELLDELVELFHLINNTIESMII